MSFLNDRISIVQSHQYFKNSLHKDDEANILN